VVLRHQLAVLRRQPPCDRAGWTRPRISEGAGAQCRFSRKAQMAPRVAALPVVVRRRSELSLSTDSLGGNRP